jgi:hypothetical protein
VQQPRPRLTSPPVPLEGAPAAASSTNSTDSSRSPAPGCVRPRPGATPTSGCRVHQRPRATARPRPPAPESRTHFGRVPQRPRAMPRPRPSTPGAARARFVPAHAGQVRPRRGCVRSPRGTRPRRGATSRPHPPAPGPLSPALGAACRPGRVVVLEHTIVAPGCFGCRGGRLLHHGHQRPKVHH